MKIQIQTYHHKSFEIDDSNYNSGKKLTQTTKAVEFSRALISIV